MGLISALSEYMYGPADDDRDDDDAFEPARREGAHLAAQAQAPGQSASWSVMHLGVDRVMALLFKK